MGVMTCGTLTLRVVIISFICFLYYITYFFKSDAKYVHFSIL